MWCLCPAFLAPPTSDEDLSFGFWILGDLRTSHSLVHLQIPECDCLSCAERTAGSPLIPDTTHSVSSLRLCISFSIHDLQGVLPPWPWQNERSQHNLHSSGCLASGGEIKVRPTTWDPRGETLPPHSGGSQPAVTFYCPA